ncbi:phage tail tape measure protein [Schinkia azotoformans]|uniref:phage tail tape measure protein n=1 Tax=Schinkia azotoformans TaxID=1454 RepID=UPI002DBC9BCD|nr:phage tail tape measure protein [Schinkia azotoformans]MEC1778399.1 phage tail tape measure protein [Schinkia azotoformans]MED4328356.1 phage tail tape measure protein [Schinkia azotoformans]
MANNTETTVTFRVFNQEFKKAMKEMNSESNELRNEFILQQEQMKGTASASDILAHKIQYLQQSQEIVNTKIEATRQQLERAKEMYGENSQEVATLRAELTKAETHEARLANNIREANVQLAEQTDVAKRASESLAKVGQKMKDIGSTMSTTVTPALSVLGAGALFVASEVDSATAKIKNSLGLTAEESEQLTGVARDIYTEGFGESFEDIQGALIQTRQNIKGLNDEELGKITTQAKVLADTFDSEVNEVTRAGSNLIEGWGLDAEKAFDLMAYGAQNGLNFSNEMFDNLAEYAPLWSNMGFTAEEYFNTLISGSKAGVYNLDYINDVMKEFQIRVKDGSKATTDAMAQLSDSTNKVWQDFLKGDGTVKDVSDAVLTELQSMDDQVKANEIGVGLFGVKWEDLESKAMYSLANVDGEIKNLDGTMQEMVETQEETFGQRFQSLLRELKDALLPLGTVLMDMANEWLPRISSVLENASAWFGNLNPPIQRLIVIVGLIVAAIGPLLVVIGTLISSIGALIPIIAGLSAPVALIIAGIIAFGVALITLWQKSETFRDGVMTGFNAIKDVALQVFEVVANFIQEKISAIQAFWDENGAQFLTAVENVFNGIMAVVDFVMPAVLFIIETVWTAIKQVIDGALNIIMGLIQVFAGIFTGDFGKMWEGVKKIFSGAVDLIIGLMSLSFVGGIKTLLTNLVKSGVNLIKGLADDIVKFFTDFVTRSKNLTDDMVSGVINFFNNLFTQASNIFNMLRTSGENVWNAISQTILGIARNIWNTVINHFSNMLSGIRTTFGNVKSTVTQIWNDVMSFFRGINLSSIGKDIMQGLLNGIGSMASRIWDKVSDITDGIKRNIKSALSINSPSKVTFEYGEFTGEGLALGIEKMKNAVSKASAELAGYVMPNLQNDSQMKVNSQSIQEGLQFAIPQSQPLHITVVSELDGYEVARNQYEYIEDMMYSSTQSKLIVKGVR